jgi:hypothetical protein
MTTIENYIASGVALLIGTAITRLFIQVKKTNDQVIKLEVEVEQLKDNQHNGFIQIEKLLDEKFKRIDDRFIHMDKTIQSSAKLFEILIEEVKKK